MILGLILILKKRSFVLERAPRGFVLMLLTIIGLQTYLISSWEGWWGAIWGARYFTEVTPLFALLCVGVFSNLSRKAFVLIALVSFLIQAHGVYGKGKGWFYDPPKTKSYANEEERMYDWSDSPLLYPWNRKLIDRQ